MFLLLAKLSLKITQSFGGHLSLRGGQCYLYVMELTIGSFGRVRTKYSLKCSISNKTLHGNVSTYEISYSARAMRVHEFEVG
jgi:hypothetical protein